MIFRDANSTITARSLPAKSNIQRIATCRSALFVSHEAFNDETTMSAVAASATISCRSY